MTGRRIGSWTYVAGEGWLLDPALTRGVRVVLDFDRLNRACSVAGAYVLYLDGDDNGAVDHFLTGPHGAAAFVEHRLDDILTTKGGT